MAFAMLRTRRAPELAPTIAKARIHPPARSPARDRVAAVGIAGAPIRSSDPAATRAAGTDARAVAKQSSTEAWADDRSAGADMFVRDRSGPR